MHHPLCNYFPSTCARAEHLVLQINGNDTTFESPSAFSIFLKRGTKSV